MKYSFAHVTTIVVDLQPSLITN